MTSDAANREAPTDVDALAAPFQFSLEGLRQAAETVHRVLQPTPQIAWPLLARRAGAEVWVKHENHLPTGAFKVRGGVVLVDALMRGDLGPVPRGTITASVGNHGQSQAFAGRRAGLNVTIVVPENNNPEKNAAMRALGAELVETGVDFSAAYVAAKALAKERGLYFVESFHPELVRGVATWAMELFEAVGDLDAVYVPIGLGSGICGLIRTRDLLGLRTRIIGVVARGADAYARSVEAGRVVPTDRVDTVADGMAVRVPQLEAVEIIRSGAERIVRVNDDEICEAIRIYQEDAHNMSEGAGAAALAALLKERDLMRGKRVALALTGANIARPLLARVLAA